MTAVEVLGLTDVPYAGDVFMQSKMMLQEIQQKRERVNREEVLQETPALLPRSQFNRYKVR